MDLVSDISLTKWLFAVLALVMCMGALAILAKRFGPQGRSMVGGRRMQLLETMHLDPRHKVCLFRHDSMEQVVVIGPQGVTHLDANDTGEIPDGDDLSIGFLKPHSKKKEEKND